MLREGAALMSLSGILRLSRSASQACGSTSLSFAVMISLVLMATRSARVRSRRKARTWGPRQAAQGAFSAFFLIDEADKPGPTLEM